MFRTKREVDKHVSDILNKIINENEKHLKGYNFARLYFQVKEYEVAKKYLIGFLSIREHHAPAHQLLAQLYENTGHPEKALQSYKRSLEIDKNQKDIVLKICELYCKLPVDHETARYWVDRADQLFPHHDIVFRLRECLVTAEGEPDRHELEVLIISELVARPNDVTLRIKLLRLYLDSERVQDAYNHALTIESKRPYRNNVEWYYCLMDIFEAFQEEVKSDTLDADFFIHLLACLDHLVYLTIVEPHALSIISKNQEKRPCSILDASSVLQIFDQKLEQAWNKLPKREGAWNYFLHHMRGQLYFRMGTLIMKRALKDVGHIKEGCRIASALFLLSYTFKPSSVHQEAWFIKMNEKQKLFTEFFHLGNLRMSHSGHSIVSLCTEDKGRWLQKIKQEVCIPQVRERIYQRLFGNNNLKQMTSGSHFLHDRTFLDSSLEFPVLASLLDYDKVAQKLNPDSLHHLVWLSLHLQEKTGKSHSLFKFQLFEGLQFSNTNLSNGSPESLCQLDVEAFLNAAVYVGSEVLQHKNSSSLKLCDSFLSVPPDIAVNLCSNEQRLWWSTMCNLFTRSHKERLGEHRRILQHGLEVIRGVGNHGLDLYLIVHLARTFADWASELESGGAISAEKILNLKTRAAHYWSISLKILEKFEKNMTVKAPKDRLFASYNCEPSSEEIFSLKEEGQLFIACRLMDIGNLENAAEILSSLSSPYGSFYLALTLKNLAEQKLESTGSKSIPEESSSYIALLKKALDALYVTMDRIRGDKNHSLNLDIPSEIEFIEQKLAAKDVKQPVKGTGFSMTNSIVEEEEELGESTDINCFLNGSLPGTPKQHSRNQKLVNVNQSTPRPSSNFLSHNRTRSTMETPQTKHTQPSPERLDAQVRVLALTQDTFFKTFLEQQQIFMDTNKAVVDALKQNKEVLKQLKKYLEDLQNVLGRAPIRRNAKGDHTTKGQDEDEEDYQDDFDGAGCYLQYYVEDGNRDPEYRNAYHYNGPSQEAIGASTFSYMPRTATPVAAAPQFNQFGYQYPAANLVQPPPPSPSSQAGVCDRSGYYPVGPGGLTFSEGQQLPQFHFQVSAPSSKSSVFSRLDVQFPNGTVPQTFNQPHLASQNNWTKSGNVPHAFQIPLPAAGSAIPVKAQSSSAVATTPSFGTLSSPVQSSTSSLPSTTTSISTTGSNLKNLLNTPSTGTGASKSVSVFSPEDKSTPKSKSDKDASDSFSSDTGLHNVENRDLDFSPLIPLPAEVAVHTGEEDEQVLFEDRAKLFRFFEQEWKERGVGTIKILYNESLKKVRLLMRRDQVLKVCANHYIVPGMELCQMKDSNRAWIWAAQDYAYEEVKQEKFCIRFKTVDIANSFKKAFDDAVLLATMSEKKADIEINKSTSIFSTSKRNSLDDSGKKTQGFPSSFLPKPGSWNCSVCYVNNSADKTVCEACESLKPVTNLSQTALTSNTPDSISDSKTTLSSSSSKFSLNPSKLSSSGSNISVTSAIKPSVSSSENFGKAKAVFGGFTFSSPPVIQEVEDTSKQEREIKQVTKPKESGKPEINKTSPFINFSFTDSSTKSEDTPKETIFGSKSDDATLDFSSISRSGQGFQKNSTFTGFVGAGTTLFGSSSLQKEDKINKEKSSAVSVSSSSVADTSDEFVPTAEFQPVIPLPELISTVTGEEEEQKIYTERAKLFRYDSEGKQWKERGIGELKILRHIKTGKFRLLMRRDQVLKICANHYLIPEMKLTPLSSSDRAWVWSAKDYSDGEIKQEQFAAKFKTDIIAQQFYQAFQNCQAKLGETSGNEEQGKASNVATNISSQTGPCIEKSSLADLFKPVAGSWECSICLIRNKSDVESCVACETPKPGSLSSLNSEKSKTSNEAKKDAAASIFPSSFQSKNTIFGNSVVPPTSSTSVFGFRPELPPVTSTSQTGFVFGNFNFTIGGSSSENKPSSVATTISSTLSTTSTFVTSTVSGSAAAASVFGQNASTPSSQVFGFKPSSTSSSESVFKFGSSSPVLSDQNALGMPNQESSEEPSSVEFRFGSPQKFEFTFSGIRSPTKTPKSPGTPSDVSRDEEDLDTSFTPLIPLPPKVDVVTGEEEEKIIYSQRAKLFRFVNSEWKERGVGDIKILKHCRFENIRLLMRRDQVLKVCLNHYLNPDMTFLPKGEKSWLWTAKDFSENHPQDEKLAVRFKTAEAAAEFKKTIDDAQKYLSSGKCETSDSEQKEEQIVSDLTKQTFPTAKSPLSSFSFCLNSSIPSTSPSTFSLANRFQSSSAKSVSIFGTVSTPAEASNALDSDCKIIFESKPTQEQIDKAAQLLLPPTFYLYETKPPCKGCKGCKDEIPVFIETVHKDETAAVSDTPSAPTSDHVEPVVGFPCSSDTPTFADLAAKTPAPTFADIATKTPASTFADIAAKTPAPTFADIAAKTPAPTFADIAAKTPAPTFADLAAKTTTTLPSPPSQPNRLSIYSGAGTPLFSNLLKIEQEKGDGGGEDVVEPSQDIHFDPVVPLPELITVKTGEEDESIIFCERSKLYRFDSEARQWKERGVGDFKILKHNQKCRYRILLRRDQVHKIACNHCICPEMELKPMLSNEKSLCWSAVDYTDDKPSNDMFAVKFKSIELLGQFKKKFEECQAIIKKSQSTAVPVSENNTEEAETSQEATHVEEQEEEEDEEDEDDDQIIFEKRATLAVRSNTSEDYVTVGVGNLCIIYDDSVYGARINMKNDSGQTLCNHIIAVQTCLRIDNKKAFWAAADTSVDPPARRHFCAMFSSTSAAADFDNSFNEGKHLAVESEIVEKEDVSDLLPGTGH